MSFDKNKYQIVRKAISIELAEFIFNYFFLKKEAVKYMYENNVVHESSTLGTWKDPQVPNVYSHYADFAMETLLIKVMPIMKKETGLNLIPTYSYARIYEKGSILVKHKDRLSCEISTTLNLGGDLWPIYLEGIKIDLTPGDMLVYLGCDLEHWRDEFTGNTCAQVFLHYNNLEGSFKDTNLYDKRPLLGLPSFIRKKTLNN
jgi:hypothetical protein